MWWDVLNVDIILYTSGQKFIVFERSLFCSFKLHLFDYKSNIINVVNYYNLK